MRDIRFRAWDKEWLAMSAPMEIFKNGQGFFFFKGFGTRCAEHEQLIVMQSTGLKDCKRTEECPEGQEGYKDDIARIMVNNYDRDNPKYRTHTITSACPNCAIPRPYVLIDGVVQWEIIGNVHQPEKMEAQDE